VPVNGRLDDRRFRRDGVDHKVGVARRRTDILRNCRLSAAAAFRTVEHQGHSDIGGHSRSMGWWPALTPVLIWLTVSYICACRWHFLVIYRMRDSVGYFYFPGSPARRRPPTCRQLALARWRFSRHGFGKGCWRVAWSSRGAAETGISALPEGRILCYYPMGSSSSRGDVD